MLPPRPMVMAGNGGETTVAPTPRSPPKYPDICGRRRLQLEVQILNRELGFLEEEVQSLEGLQPVSRCCKEVNEFVGTNSDPLVPINKKRCKSCHFWRSLGSKLGSCLSCIFCCTSCSCQCKKPKCYNCCPQPRNLCSCCFNCKFHCNCFRCSCPKLSCCHLPRPFCCCYNKPSCCGSCPRCCSWNCSCCSCHEISCCKTPKCCCPPTISCPEYSCGCVFDCPKCTEVHLCPRCTKPCCVTGCLC